MTSGTSTVKTLETVKCTITAQNAGGYTTGLESDFDVASTIGGTDVTVPVLPSGGTGSTFEFTVKAPATLITFTIKGILASGPTDLNEVTLTVKGRPGPLSTVVCTALSTTLIRAGAEADCIITVKDAFGDATSGEEADFATPIVDGGTFNGPLVAAGGGATMTFKATAPSTPGSLFVITGKLADGREFNSAPTQLSVIGQPTAKSTLDCVGMTSGIASVRASEDVLCTITVRDDSGTTTGMAADFTTGTITGGTSARELVSTRSGALMTFKVTAPSTTGAAFTVRGQLNGGTDFEQGDFVLVVVGTPTTASTVACAGTDSGSTTVKTLESVTCTITVKDAGGATTGLASDFGATAVVGGSGATGVVLPNGGDGSTMTFTVNAPSTITTFTITAKLDDGSPLNQVTMTVKGRPTTASTIECVSDADGTTLVRVGTGVTCTITVKDGSGPPRAKLRISRSPRLAARPRKV